MITFRVGTQIKPPHQYFKNTRLNTVPKAYVSPRFVHNHLKELVEKDTCTSFFLFEDKKKELAKLYGEDLSLDVKTPSLADDLVFLHQYYLLSGCDVNVQHLRKFAMGIYELETEHITPKVHDAIIDILRKCDAI